MKNICFIVDSIFSIGGVQRVTAVLAKELAKDNNVTIVTFDKPELLDTSMYNLNESDITYRFFSYPQVNYSTRETKHLNCHFNTSISSLVLVICW